METLSGIYAFLMGNIVTFILVLSLLVFVHEMGHVVARHGAEHIAKQQLTEGLTGAAVLATYDPNNPSSRNSAAVAAMACRYP